MNHYALKAKFLQFLEQQAQSTGNNMTAIGYRIADRFFEAAVSAMTAVAARQTEPFMRVIPNDTGTGKSLLSHAFIAAAACLDPTFSAAIFTPTIKLAIETQNSIEKLLGGDTTTLWSVHHDPNRNEQAALVELGFLPTRLCRKNELPDSRLLIGTTAKLKLEAKTGEDTGCLRYQGQWRSIVFIDEHPDLLDVFHVTSQQVHDLFSRIMAFDPEHYWLSILKKAIDNMMQVMITTQQPYIPVTLLDAEDAQVLKMDLHAQLESLTDPDLSDDERRKQVTQWHETVECLIASARHQAFYSRKDRQFCGYQRHLDTTYPGYVVLDATADVYGLLSLLPGVQILAGERLDYGQLDVYGIIHPNEYSEVYQLNEAAVRKYGHWIRVIIEHNTQPGDKVLVIAHRRVLNLDMFSHSDDPAIPLDWNGRRVNTQHWGAGIGTNQYARKTHIFLFGDYHPRRTVTIAHLHGWSDSALTEQELELAQGKKQPDGRYVPLGRYGQVFDGHLLRWTKQLAMRGNARNADTTGQCGTMKLFVSGDVKLWLPRLQELFPGATLRGGATQDLPGVKPTGREGLRQLLLTTSAAEIGSDEVEAETGIKGRNLVREFTAIKDFASARGWSICTARDLGRAGKRRFLVNEGQLGRKLLKGRS